LSVGMLPFRAAHRARPGRENGAARCTC
jgi:hypothetical protein